MEKILGLILLLFFICCPAFAIKITGFGDTDTYIQRGKDIVVAECISVPSQEKPRVISDGLQVVEVNILKTLKGGRKPGRTQIATHYNMKPNTIYLLYNLGGKFEGTDFLAVPQLSVVPLPEGFSMDELKDKGLKEQVQYIFSRRLFEVESELDRLLKEEKLLEKAFPGICDEWYESKGPVNIGHIVEHRIQTDNTHFPLLDLENKKLLGQFLSDESRLFYLGQIDTSRTPYWEFSPCEANKIEDMAGKPLKARFSGMYTLGRGEIALRWTGRDYIDVSVGQVLLARTVDEPHKIFIIQIIAQKEHQEQMSVRYAVINQ